MSQEVSKYVNNALASKKKHIYTRLLDYFLTFVVCYLVFTIVLPISSNFSIVQDYYKELSACTLDSANYIDSTRLQKYNEDKTSIVDVNTSGGVYLSYLAKTNAYLYDIAFPIKQNDGTYIDHIVGKEETFVNELESYSLDNVSYYYKKFKKEETSLNNYVFDNVDYKNDIDSYMYLKIMEININKYANEDVVASLSKKEGLSRYLILSRENAELLIKKVAKGESTTTIDDLYNYLLGTYVKAIQYGVKDVETHSVPYIEITNRYNKAYQNLSGALVIIYLVSYTIGFLLLIFIPRLIFKEYKSVGQKVMGVAMCDVDEKTISWWQYLIYYLVNFILFFTSSMIAFIFTGIFGVTTLYVVPHVTLLAVLLFILTFNLVSLFMPLANKHRFDIPRFFSRIVVKDINEYDVPVGMEAKDEAEKEDGK